MNICTIIAKNYLPYARVLARSHAEHYPQSQCFVLIIDETEGYVDAEQEPFEVLTIADLDLDAFDEMRGTYDILELSTAVKPWLLRHMLAEHASEPGIAYLDPDIQVHRPLTAIEDALREHPMVLTPHLTGPMPRDGKRPNETDILVAGVYNLGFIALAQHPESDTFLDWWAERLLSDCRNAPGDGLFVDQRWVDFVPGLVPHLTILRDPQYNLAYWNLPHRDLAWDAERGYTVDGVPLAFFHFSGYDPEVPYKLSKHQNRVSLTENPALQRLCDAYGEALLSAGWEETRDLPYEHDRLPSGLKLTRRMRVLYHEGLEDDLVPRSIFTPAGEAEFLAWLNAPPDEQPLVSRYLYDIWKNRLDVQRAYGDLGDPEVVDGFLGWAGVFGASEIPIPEPLLPERSREVREEMGAHVPARVNDRAPARVGMNVTGYLRAELGIGEIARQMVAALDAVGVPNAPIGLHAPNSREGHAFGALETEVAPFPVNLLCVNADGVPAFVAEAGETYFEDRYTIGLWWWETSSFPDRFDGSFEYVDEIWAGTRFVAEALAAVAPVPVVHIPMPVVVPDAPPLAPGELGWPDAFTFYFSYDYNSVVQRKNPLAVVRAYTAAFTPDEGAALVLKCINGDRHPESHAAVREAIGDRADIVLIDQYLDAADKNRLAASCDCYVSLHRSEGLGLTIAEAMYLAKPVIATAYSGNTDYMGEHNSFPVDYRLVPIGEGADPYPADGEWAEPDVDHAARLMRQVFEDPQEARRRAARGALDLRAQHSLQATGLAMDARLRHIAPRLDRAPREVEAGGGGVARELIAQGTEPRTRAGGGPFGAALRRAVLRAIRPYTSRQQEINRALDEDVHAAEQRLTQRLGELHAGTLGQVRAQGREIERLQEELDVLRRRAASTAHADGVPDPTRRS